MQWTYHITAAAQPRVLARLLQLFDQQSLDLDSLTLTRDEATLTIRLTVTTEPALAHRLHAKLHRLHDVEHVQLTETSLPGKIEAVMETKPKALFCPTCRKVVLAADPDFPFCSDRCRILDLGKWASGGYVISSPIHDPELLDELEGLQHRSKSTTNDSDG